MLNTLIKTMTNTWSTQALTQQYCVSGQTIERRNLKRYIKFCRFSNSDYVPVTYPFVIAFPLLMRLMTSALFPISILGLIHYKNSITQHAPILKNAILTIICSACNDNTTVKGRFIETQIDIFVNGQLVWACTSTFLQKSRQNKANKHSQSAESSSGNNVLGPDNNVLRPDNNVLLDAQSMQTVSSFEYHRLDALKYAYISGDTNPIHLHSIPAKLMGFRSTIMHGMFAKAHVLAQLEAVIDIQHISMEVQFKSAIFLPTQVCLNVALSPKNNTFSLTNSNKRVTHLSGVIYPLLNKTN
ncbi:MaoC/PaaZ C-terminal domain-containing protein [Moritella dasanensis]|uniref:MaoC/PaaZ C-terminal domain-containing protein n=1 Tax=Moritella dasanensis TaxID=428031 RepID=UPI001ED92884|nr:MaoC/PaaZ C-terminal domain-containing protein [Moritella dasanensis]